MIGEEDCCDGIRSGVRESCKDAREVLCGEKRKCYVMVNRQVIEGGRRSVA